MHVTHVQLSDATASFPFCLSQKLTFTGKLHLTAAVGEISSHCTPVCNVSIFPHASIVSYNTGRAFSRFPEQLADKLP